MRMTRRECVGRCILSAFYLVFVLVSRELLQLLIGWYCGLLLVQCAVVFLHPLCLCS